MFNQCSQIDSEMWCEILKFSEIITRFIYDKQLRYLYFYIFLNRQNWWKSFCLIISLDSCLDGPSRSNEDGASQDCVHAAWIWCQTRPEKQEGPAGDRFCRNWRQISGTTTRWWRVSLVKGVMGMNMNCGVEWIILAEIILQIRILLTSSLLGDGHFNGTMNIFAEWNVKLQFNESKLD